MLSAFAFGSEHYFTLTSGAIVKIIKPDAMALNQSIFYGHDSALHLNDGVTVQWVYNGLYFEGVLWMLLNEIIQHGLLEDTSFDGSYEAPPFIPPPFIPPFMPSSETGFYNYQSTLSDSNYCAPCVQISAVPTQLESKAIILGRLPCVSSRFKCIFKNCDRAFGRTNNRASHHKEHLQNYLYNGACPVCGKKLQGKKVSSLLQHISRMHFKQWDPSTH